MAEEPVFIGKYRLLNLVAKGGMGAVYKAVHPTLKREVILKKLTVRNAQFIERFKREAAIMMDFKHDNIVAVWDHFKEGASYYIALEYVDGFSLGDLIKRERALPSSLAMYLFLHVCRALKYAHDRGVIHRDIKPANVLLSRSGEIKLADFGIATRDNETDTGLTTQGMTLGTPSYMPPEQFENSKGVDKCADIYAMGVMLYEMVTGKKPFPGNFAPDTIAKIQKGQYLRVQRINPKVDRTVVRLCQKMIRPKKEQRFQDLAPVIRILERRLKQEDFAEEKDRLHALMNRRPFTPKKKPRKMMRRILAIALPSIAVLAIGLSTILSSGVHRGWFQANDWGRLRVEVTRPSNQEEALPVSIKLYTERGGELSFLQNLEIPGLWQRAKSAITALVPSQKEGQSDLVSTDTVYLPAGWYRLKIQTGNKVLWDSVYLEPLAIQRMQGRGAGLALRYESGAAIPKPVTFSFAIRDERLKSDITDQCDILFQTKAGSWVPFERFPESERLSGRVFRIRVAAKGYDSRVFSLLVEPGQTELGIQASLAPLTATLVLKTGLSRVTFTLNDQKAVLSGTKERRLVPLRLSRDEELRLELPPGSWAIGSGSGADESRLELQLAPGETRSLEFYRDDGSRTILLR